MAIIQYIKLARPYQWYKNLLIFLPLIFGGFAFNLNVILYTIIGWFSLSLISSSGYVINDIVDRKKDLIHHEKKNRPIASGRIKISYAVLFSILLLVSGLFIGYSLNWQFMIIGILLFLFTLLYTLFLKNEIFADVITISINFVLRSVSGAYVLLNGNQPYIYISPWLILGPFFLSLFLATGKRRADMILLSKDAIKHKKTLGRYTPEITRILMTISTTMLIIVYTFYSFQSDYPQILITLPLVLFGILRFLLRVEEGSIIARHPHKVIYDIRLMLLVLAIAISIFIVIYFNDLFRILVPIQFT